MTLRAMPWLPRCALQVSRGLWVLDEIHHGCRYWPLAFVTFGFVGVLTVPFLGWALSLTWAAKTALTVQLLIWSLKGLERVGHRPVTQMDLKTLAPVIVFKTLPGNSGPETSCWPSFPELLKDDPTEVEFYRSRSALFRQKMAAVLVKNGWISIRDFWKAVSAPGLEVCRTQPKLHFLDGRPEMPVAADWEPLMAEDWAVAKAAHAHGELAAHLPPACSSSARTRL